MGKRGEHVLSNENLRRKKKWKYQKGEKKI